ncbi:helix-turn-helix domain-containing protein [Polymorphospora sp. 2-325]|uniref:Helix-turn-helix domain-containing protein n=1 Tax=Polymorphospora lycopeni TaxID=3140240 RepID=A0ABV5D2V7_9ACTN
MVVVLSFGQRLRQLRRSAGMTIEELSETSGVSGRAISDMERGRSRAPQARTLSALADALGLDDSDRADLVELARSRRSESTVGRPRGGELPRGVSEFVGRAPELRLLHRHGTAGAVDGPTPVAVVHGPPGLGKTAFAVHAAGQLRDRFPDGQFYVDLRGTDAAPMAAGEALTRLLRALDVNPRAIADDEPERAGQLRAILRQRRCLLVLDNAAHEAQVRPLMPGAGAGLVLVTSRRALGGLEGVLRIGLPPLAPAESAGLLRTLVRDLADRAVAQDVEVVARLCGHLPLALRIAGTRLVSRPEWTMAHLAARLSDADRRLASLSVGDLGVEPAFALSYAQLPGPARAMFRRLAHVPGVDFAAPLGAVLTGTGPHDAEEQLEELVELGLLQPVGFDRYRFHDLIRLFAEKRLRNEEPADTRAATERRMIDWLLETAIVAGRWFEPGFGAPPADWRGLVPLGTAEQAQSWLQAEADNWLAALRGAAAAGQHQRLVDVAEAMHWYSDRMTHWGHWSEVYQLSSAAAARLPDRRQEITHINYHAWAQAVCGRRYDESAALAMDAYQLAEALGDVGEQANALSYAGDAWRFAGEYGRALWAYRRAQELADSAGNHDEFVQMGLGVGLALIGLGRFDEALAELRTVLREVDTRPVAPSPKNAAQVVARVFTARALAELRRWPEAIEEATAVLPAATGFGALTPLGHLHLALGRAYAALGSTDEARGHLTRAVELFDEGGAREGAPELARSALAALDA